MIAMSQPISNSIASSHRRFLLLPEEYDRIPVAAPRIRRYRLSSLGRHAGVGKANLPRTGSVTDADRCGETSG
jgi:hypothetical protein